MLSSNLRILNSKLRILDYNLRIISSNLRILSSNLRILNSKLRILDYNLRIISSNLRILDYNLTLLNSFCLIRRLEHQEKTAKCEWPEWGRNDNLRSLAGWGRQLLALKGKAVQSRVNTGMHTAPLKVQDARCFLAH